MTYFPPSLGWQRARDNDADLSNCPIDRPLSLQREKAFEYSILSIILPSQESWNFK